MLRGTAQTGLAVGFAGVLNGLMTRQAMAATTAQLEPVASPYGPVFPTADQNTGLPLLQLPRGFTYRTFSWQGDRMDDGNVVKTNHDGMGVVSVGGAGNRDVFLIRNHEMRRADTMFNVPGQYDKASQSFGGNAGQLSGGCVVLRVRNGQLVDQRATLGGTIVNCAGGVTPWGTWISSEETLYDGTAQGGRKHGYNFECSIDPRVTTGEPLVAMGRFPHEAVAVDPRTGWVYQTEDNRNLAGFYRYKPDDTSGRYGSLARGGRLESARIVGAPGAKLLALGGTNAVANVGQVLEVEWVSIDNPDSNPVGSQSGPYAEGLSKGALTMSRLEGIWYQDGSFAVVDTSFGRDSSNRDGRGLGAVWTYTPSRTDPERGFLKLIYAAAGRLAGNNPDNITISPRGGMLTCDDGANVVDQFGEGQRLMGYTGAGESYIFAKSNVVLTDSDIAKMGRTGQFPADDYRGDELAGACFDPRGDTLFVNNFNPGFTAAIRGPWKIGNL
jgi:secreted PhoX family phosphatase